MKGRGIVLNEPSVIALNRQTGEVLATGREAWQMIGRTPGYIVAVRPLRGGAITDFEITERMIRLLLQRVGVSRFTRPKVVICVPSAITEVERRAVTDAARRAGAADANLIEQPMAAAIGADLPIDEPVGNMVIDIGGGTSETAVISLGGIVALEAVRVGSFDIDAAIQNYVRREHGIAIGERTAEEIKVAIGSADPTEDENQAEVRGRDLMIGPAQDGPADAGGDPLRHRGRGLLDRGVGDPLPRQGAARAVAGLPRSGHVPRRRRRPAARPGVADPAGHEGAREAVERAPGGRRARRRPRHRALRGFEGNVHGSPSLMRVPGEQDAFAGGLARIREQFQVPVGFPAAVEEAAAAAVAKRPGPEHVDRTDVEFVTLDPASATDLDQAFAIERDGGDLVLRYAIADVGWFVAPGDPLDVEAWSRAVTVYLPDGKAPLYPPRLSEGAASLLPDGPRPAVVFVVRIGTDGAAVLDGAERAVIHSRAKLAYDAVREDQLPDGFAELSARIEAAEAARDAPRVEFPEQEVELAADGTWQLAIRPRLESEDRNAGMSLATNLAVADALHAAGTGLFRVMPEPTERAIARLRHTARAFGLSWPAELDLLEFQRTLPVDDRRTDAFLLAVRRASGGAAYEPYVAGARPWHAAMAATYAHATAPLRRLADRYVVEAALAVANGAADLRRRGRRIRRAPGRDGQGRGGGQPRRRRRHRPRRSGRAVGARRRHVRRRRRRRGRSRRPGAAHGAGRARPCRRPPGRSRRRGAGPGRVRRRRLEVGATATGRLTPIRVPSFPAAGNDGTRSGVGNGNTQIVGVGPARQASRR